MPKSNATKDLTQLSEERKQKYARDLNQDCLDVRYQTLFYQLLSKGYDEYTLLFSAFELGVEREIRTTLHYRPELTEVDMNVYRKGYSVMLNEQEYNMYLNFIEDVILPTFIEPPNNSKLMITTHKGGTHLAYYENGEYTVPMSDGTVRIEDATVLYWRFYHDVSL